MENNDEKKGGIKMERALRCIQGGYDLHVHSAPSRQPRCVNDFELLSEADVSGMAGVLIKNHDEPTASRATLCELAVKPQVSRCYGGVVLNEPVGGINACAVEAAAQMGTKEVWFPTCDAQNEITFGGGPHVPGRAGLTVLNERGEVKPEVFEVFEVARHFNLAVGTGHLSLKEIEAVCLAGRENGIRMVFTHPDWRSVKAPIELQRKMSEKGVLIEKAWVPVSLGEVSAQQMAASIREIGTRNVFMVTDHGADYLKKPLEAMIEYVCALLEFGFDENEIGLMLRENPKRVLGE